MNRNWARYVASRIGLLTVYGALLGAAYAIGRGRRDA